MGSENMIDIERYMARIGLRDVPNLDREGLAILQRAHLATVPFENLDVVAGVAVRTDLSWSIPKIVDRQRGGWCFELNGAFGALLDAIGFSVMYLGCAVLLDGPNTMIDHVALEVTLDQPYLVDVGFGESFVSPLELNRAGPQTDPAGVFEFIDSSQGTTLTWHDAEAVPVPQYRFKRVRHELGDFDAASERLRTDDTLDWSSKPFATRLVHAASGASAERITLQRTKKKVHGAGTNTETPVEPEDWNAELAELFGIEMEGRSDDDRPHR